MARNPDRVERPNRVIAEARLLAHRRETAKQPRHDVAPRIRLVASVIAIVVGVVVLLAAISAVVFVLWFHQSWADLARHRWW